MINVEDADKYLSKHFFNQSWSSATIEEREASLNTAEMLLQSHFNLNDGVKDTDNYFHATCEQALHLLNYAPERYQLQMEGVTYYAVDGLSFTMKNNLISPIAKGFLKPFIKRRVGDAK